MGKKFIIPIISLLVVISLFLIEDTEEGIDDEIQQVNILISLGGDNNNREIYEKHISRFNRDNPKTQAIPYFVYSDTEALLKLIYVKEANQKYDVAYLSSNQIYSLTKLNLIEPLDSYIMEGFGISWLEEFTPVSMANSIVSGKIWSIPIIRNARVVLFNKNLFSYNGDTISLDDLVELSKTQNSSENMVEVLLPLSELMIEYLAYNKPFDEGELTNKATFLNIIEENKINMVNAVRQSIEFGYMKDYSYSKNQDVVEFINGKVPILVSNTNHVNKILDEAQFPISVVPLMIDSNTTFPLDGINLYLVNQSSSVDYDISWNTLKTLWEIGTDESETIANGNIPLQDSKLKAYSQKEEEISKNKSFLKAMQGNYNGYSGIAIDQNTKINLLLVNALRNILYKDVNVNDSMKEIQNIVNQILGI